MQRAFLLRFNIQRPTRKSICSWNHQFTSYLSLVLILKYRLTKLSPSFWIALYLVLTHGGDKESFLVTSNRTSDSLHSNQSASNIIPISQAAYWDMRLSESLYSSWLSFRLWIIFVITTQICGFVMQGQWAIRAADRRQREDWCLSWLLVASQCKFRRTKWHQTTNASFTKSPRNCSLIMHTFKAGLKGTSSKIKRNCGVMIF